VATRRDVPLRSTPWDNYEAQGHYLVSKGMNTRTPQPKEKQTRKINIERHETWNRAVVRQMATTIEGTRWKKRDPAHEGTGGRAST